MKRTVLITGATGGLGRELVKDFSEDGCRIIGVYQKSDIIAQNLMHEIELRGAQGCFLKVDVSRKDEVEKFFENIREETIDVLINNAGITADKLILKMHPLDWENVLNVNLKGPFLLIKEVMKKMSQKSGALKHIINIGSLMGFTGNEGQTNYAASKAGLMALTRVAALEGLSMGIIVNAVIPGALNTEMNQAEDSRHRSISDISKWIVLISKLMVTTGQVFLLEDRITKYEGLQPILPGGGYGDRDHNIDR